MTLTLSRHDCDCWLACRWWLVADAAWAEGAGVGTDLFEGAGERFDVGVGEVLGEVLFDSVSVVAARLVEGGAALLGEEDEDRAAVVVGADAADEAGFFHAVDDAVKPLLL
jgi:hypothetical protein